MSNNTAASNTTNAIPRSEERKIRVPALWEGIRITVAVPSTSPERWITGIPQLRTRLLQREKSFRLRVQG